MVTRHAGLANDRAESQDKSLLAAHARSVVVVVSRHQRGSAILFVTGVDENGLGPLLGPLVVTAVTLEVSRYRAARWLNVGRDLGIDDSKSTAGFGKMAVAEGLALAVCERLFGRIPSDVDELLAMLALRGPDTLRQRCPRDSAAQCWSKPISLPCFSGDVGLGRNVIDRMQARGAQLQHARTVLACTGELNSQLEQGVSRVELDLSLMEELVLDARAHCTSDLTAVCGMVGGIRSYMERFRHFPLDGLSPVAATRGTLAFDVCAVGQVRFEIDADARHLPVAFASMIGKYVRELWMERQNRFYRGHDEQFEAVSGYHDSTTQRFVANSLSLRSRLGIDLACFERMSAKDLSKKRQLALF